MPNKCFECGKKSQANHHVVPRFLGGTKTIPLCQKCHDLVHHSRHVRKVSVGRLTSLALNAKKERNEYTGGKLPFGYKLADDCKQLIPNPLEYEAIKQARQLRNEGLNFRRIGMRLAERGFMSRGGNTLKSHQIKKILTDAGAKEDNVK